jgi:outer membrane protein assembly factor BamB
VTSGEANKWLDVTVMSYDPSNGIELWNTRTGKLERTFSDGAAKFRSTVFVSSDDKYVVARTTGENIDVGKRRETARRSIGLSSRHRDSIMV